MKKRVFFKSREIDMRKKVAALITYSFEYPEKENEINLFLIQNDFLVKESIIQLKNEKSIKYWLEKGDFETLFDIINSKLILILNPFIEPIPFKDRLQRKKNKELVTFCQFFFWGDSHYMRLANLTPSY